MKKLLGIFALSGMLAVNACIFAVPAKANESLDVVKGIKGKIDGVDTCHCPDDSGTCNCANA